MGDTHNLVSMIMSEHNLGLQAAIDRAGEMCFGCITKFEECRQALPSRGSDLDHQVQRYIQGLEDWISGSLYWSFISKRYFASEEQGLMENRLIQLEPRILLASD